MKRHLKCSFCKKYIEEKRNLVTTAFFLDLRVFHGYCFEKQLLKFKYPFSNIFPINTLFGTLFTCYTFCIGIILLITEPSIIWSTFFFPFLYRLISYWKIERYF